MQKRIIMYFNFGAGGEAKPHSSCFMTTAASTLGSVEQTTGWWAVSLLDQNDEATVPRVYKAFWRKKDSDWKLHWITPSQLSTSVFKLILLCSLCPDIDIFHVQLSIPLVNLIFQIRANRFCMLQYCSCLYGISVFPHMEAKKCWQKNPTAVKWSSLTLVILKWCFAERSSLIFVPPQAPRSIVMC